MPVEFNQTFSGNALGSDGGYVFETLVASGAPNGPNTGLLGLPGSANWGPVGVPTYFSDYDTGSAIFGDTQVTFGNSGASDYSIMARVDLAETECSNFLGVRVTDGTDVAATGTLADQAAPASTHNLVTFTAVHTGSGGNRIKWQLDLVSGTTSVLPVYRLTVLPPFGNAEVFNGIKGYTSSAYVSTVFVANLVAAVNGTNNTPASQWLIAAAVVSSPSTLNPFTGQAFPLAAGTDGSVGLTDTSITGTDGLGAARTGLYALRGLLKAANVALPGVTSTASFAVLATFAQSELCVGYWNFALGTGTSAAIASRSTNSLSSPFVRVVEDWLQVVDPVLGTTRWIDPAAKDAGIAAGQPAWQYTGNHPKKGTPNVLATESTIAVPIAVGSTDATARQQNGIAWIGNPIPGGAVFGAYHGVMSDGVTDISDVRMAFLIALTVEQILGGFVGDMQTTDPNDTTRGEARAAVNAYMTGLMPPNQRQITAYNDVLDSSNNTPATLDKGIMLAQLEVETLHAVHFAVAAAQVGSGVSIVVDPVSS